MLVCECLDDSIRTLTHMGPSTQFRFAITSHAHTRSPKALAGPNQAAIVKLERLPQSMMVQMRSLTHPLTHTLTTHAHSVYYAAFTCVLDLSVSILLSDTLYRFTCLYFVQSILLPCLPRRHHTICCSFSLRLSLCCTNKLTNMNELLLFGLELYLSIYPSRECGLKSSIVVIVVVVSWFILQYFIATRQQIPAANG